ncbi:MAG: hypothetical protein LBJ41_05315 [Treponema sp.]|jgi:hypothetical protein|nr:hypothetical protein [Treponema sp.]
MIKRFLLVFLCCLSLVSLYAQTPLSSTALEQQRREALVDALNVREVLFAERSLFSAGGFGSSIYVSFHPETSETDAAGTRLILAFPFAGTNASEGTSSFGIEVGIAFIEAIREQSALLSIPVLIAFLGDETAKLPKEERRPHIGLQDLYTTLDSPENTVLLYVDIETAPEQLLIHHGAAYTITARNALEGLNTLCKSQRIPYTLAVRFNELYELGLVDGPDVISGAAGQEINALYMETGKRRVNGVTIAPQTLANTLVSYTASLALTMENLDYHFLVFDFFGNLIIISETLTITLFALIMALFFFTLLVYTIVYRKRWIMQWGSFIRRIWVPVFFVSIMILCLEVSGSFIMLVSNLFAIDSRIVDYGRASFKILIALFLFSLFSPLQQVFKIPRKATFYGSIAILFVALGVFIAIFLEIALIPLLLSIFLLMTLGGFIRIPFLTYLCAFSLPILGLGRFLNILVVGGERLASIILAENVQTSLYFSVIMLPFMCILERAKALSVQRRESKKPPDVSNVSSMDRQRRAIIRPLIYSAGILLVSLLVFMVYMNVLAKVPLTEAERRSLVEEAGNGATDVLSIETTTQVFLERRTVQITLSARGEPARFDLYLDSNDGTRPVLYSSPMPFETNEQRNSLVLIMGEGPPNPLTIEIVVPLGFFDVLRVEALYTTWDPAIDSLPLPTTDDYLLKVSKTVPIS